MPRGNKNLGKQHGFKKGDPRINRKGAPKKLPKLKALMDALLGGNEDDVEDTPMAEIVRSLIEETKKKTNPLRVAAAKEILDRAYGKARQEIQVDNGPGTLQQPIINVIKNPDAPNLARSEKEVK